MIPYGVEVPTSWPKEKTDWDDESRPLKVTYIGRLEDNQKGVMRLPRILSEVPRSQEDFAIRLELFFSELLGSYLANRDTIRILYREFEQLVPHGVEGVVGRLTEVNAAIAEFVNQGIQAGLVAPGIDADIVAGLLLDRVANQARFVAAHSTFFGVSTLDDEYRKHWVQATLHIVLHGICGTGAPAA